MGELFLNNLVFSKCLGSGSFGLVFTGEHTVTLQKSATKFVCKPSRFTDEEQIAFERESIICRNLPSHVNIVKIFDVLEKSFSTMELEEMWKPDMFEANEQHAIRDTVVGMANREGLVTILLIQMQLCGESLRNWLQDDSTANMKPQVLHSNQLLIITDIYEGLKFLHRNKIIHRDIKPENTMFSYDEECGFAYPMRLVDFGLCRTCHSAETRTSPLTSRVGTFEYRAPEVSQEGYGFQCDIFSFGLVMWEVTQMISASNRRALFDSLVYDGDDEVVHEHATFDGLKQSIVHMTMRKPADRMMTLDTFKLEELARTWKLYYSRCHTVDAQDIHAKAGSANAVSEMEQSTNIPIESEVVLRSNDQNGLTKVFLFRDAFLIFLSIVIIVVTFLAIFILSNFV